jgi:hypothetical protein
MAHYCIDCYKQLINQNITEPVVYSQAEELCDNCKENKFIVLDYGQPMSIAECQVETQKHIETVRKYIRFMIDKLDMRGVKHDASKLESPEVEAFAENTSILKNLTYGSDDYLAQLEKLKPTLEHHYAANRHHPEHFVNGVNDMTLIDLLEMFCDWKASTLRQNDGNLLKSIDISAERFNIDPQLKQILENTARMIDEHED